MGTNEFSIEKVELVNEMGHLWEVKGAPFNNWAEGSEGTGWHDMTCKTCPAISTRSEENSK